MRRLNHQIGLYNSELNWYLTLFYGVLGCEKKEIGEREQEKRET
jgi:hypothetical protein